MEHFLVGGAVRDQLLGRAVKDRDYVVVGSTATDMLLEGFTQVGADFPVFLHPETKEEYALARQERKTGTGYHGFETHFEPTVTLEQDLARRDLTINAMAVDGHGRLIDPFGGQKDLKNGILRHTSEAFVEDPVRVLRVARFAARFGFEVHPDTKHLMNELVKAGELDHLTPERVWSEFERAMMEDLPHRFFWTLSECGAMSVLFPELGRTIMLTGQALERSMLFNLSLVERCMVVFSLLTSGEVISLCERLRAPSEVRMMGVKFVQFLQFLADMRGVKNAVRMVDEFKGIDAFRHPDHLATMARLRSLAWSSEDAELTLLMRSHRVASRISFASLTIEQQQTLKGADIGKAIDELRVREIESLL